MTLPLPARPRRTWRPNWTRSCPRADPPSHRGQGNPRLADRTKLEIRGQESPGNRSTQRHAAIVGTAACGNPVNGAATPTASTLAPASSPASSSDNPFGSLNQCQLVDQILAGQGFPPATPSVADSKRSCRSKKTSDNAAKDPAAEVGIALQNGQKYTDNIQNPNSAHEGNVDGRKLIEQRDLMGSPGGCQIGMEVGPNARALVIVLIGDDTAAACKKAEDVATALDKRLPRS